MSIKIKVTTVVTHQDGRVLLIKEKLPKKDVPLWNIVKGTYHGGETVFEAAIRECREEASLAVTLTGSLGTYVSEEGGEVYIQFNFTAEPTSTSGAARIADEKTQEEFGESISEVRWFSREELEVLRLENFVSLRTYTVIQNLLKGVSYPIDSVIHTDK